MKILYSIVFIVLFVNLFSKGLWANIINVPDLEYPTIQTGIDSSNHGDTVLVAQGTYYENINFNGKNIVLCSEYIFNLDTMDIKATVIDGSNSGCVVVFENGEDSTAVIYGFTITNGYSDGDYSLGGGITCINYSNPQLVSLIITKNEVYGDYLSQGGAGILCKDHSSPKIDDVKIIDNLARGCAGSAVRCADSSSVNLINSMIAENRSVWGTVTAIGSSINIENTIIENNGRNRSGGGLYLENSEASISNTKILNNRVSQMGGGIFSMGSTFTFDNVLVVNNSATDDDDEGEGGGLFIFSSSYGRVENSTLSSNMALQGGGGISIAGSHLEIENVVIEKNYSKWFGLGGGICVWGSESIVEMDNVKIYKNVARRKGGGIYCTNDPNVKMSLTNVTISHNRVEYEQGGGIYFESPSNLEFSVENPPSIFLNKAPLGGADLAMRFDENMNAVVDSFTVSEPSAYHLYPRDNFNLTIQNSLFNSTDADLYVSPDGSDSNTGTSASKPLKSVNAALAFASTDSTKQRYIHLAEGTYSPSLTGEDLPFYGRSFVSIVGQNSENTFIDGENEYNIFYLLDNQNFNLKNLALQNAYSDYGNAIRASRGQNISFENLIVKDVHGTNSVTGIFLGGGPHNLYTLKNVQITNNSLDSTANQGAALWLSGARANLINLTISDNNANHSQEYCGLFIDSYSEVNIVNSIIYNNQNKQIIFGNYFIPPPSLTIAYSNIQGGREGITLDSSIVLNWLEGNIDEDPQFIGGESFDYHLYAESPCIDAGTAFLEFNGDTIVNLLPEEYEGIAPDMGVYGISPIDAIVEDRFIPKQYHLFQNYPNPFNSTTTIKYQVSKPSFVSISVYDITGQLVDVLTDGKKIPGIYRVSWDASQYASGIYLYNMSTGNSKLTRKMLLVK